MRLQYIILPIIYILLSSCNPATQSIQPTVKPFYGNKDWVIVEDIPFEEPITGVSGVVPAGFVTDFASVPRSVWSFMSPHGTYSSSAIAHDYLYWEQPFPKTMSSTDARKTADKAMLEMMKRDGVSKTQQKIIYNSLRVGGNKAWNQNKKNYDMGVRKKVPPHMIKDIPPRSTWPQYRAYLDKQKIPK